MTYKNKSAIAESQDSDAVLVTLALVVEEHDDNSQSWR